MKNFLSVLISMLAASATAQTVQQGGNVTPGHIAVWAAPGVIKDGGTSSNPTLTSLGITNNSGYAFGITTGPVNLSYNALQFGITSGYGATISVGAYNGAATLPLYINAGGTSFVIGTTNWLSALFDSQFGTTTGSMLCRGSSVWQLLPPAPSGYILTAQGAGSCPTYLASGVIVPGTFRAITSGNTDTAVTADGTIAWNSSNASAKTESIYTCASGTKGRSLTIVDEYGNAAYYPITLQSSGSTFDGANNYSMSFSYQSITIQCDGNGNWVII